MERITNKISKQELILVAIMAVLVMFFLSHSAKAFCLEDVYKIFRPKINSCEIIWCEDFAVNTEQPDAEKQPEIEHPAKRSLYVTVTAYSSTPDQTDSTPFITANGSHVYDGTLAANFLPFGAKVRFPDYSGDKIYTVEDRMHRRFSDRADIWFATRQDALNFGKRKLKMEVL